MPHAPRRLRSPSSARPRAGALALGLGLSAVAALAPGPAAAAPTAGRTGAACTADALTLSVLGGPPVTPIRAEPPAGCAPASGTLLATTPSVLAVRAVAAETSTPSRAAAVAEARIAGLRISAADAVGLLTGPLLSGPDSITGTVDAAVARLTGDGGVLSPVGGLLSGLLGGIVPVGTTDGALLGPVTAALPDALRGVLPDVLTADAVTSRAAATCRSGAPVLEGDATITGLRVAGTTVDADDAAARTVSLDTAALRLGDLLSVDDVLRAVRVRATGVLALPVLLVTRTTELSLYDLLHTRDPSLVGAVNGLLATLTGGVTLGSLLSSVTAGLEPALDAIPVALPAGLLRARVEPRGRTTDGATLSQSALVVDVTALGRPLVRADLANARVSTAGVDCRPVLPPAEPPVVPPAEPPADPPPTVTTTAVPPAAEEEPVRQVAGVADPERFTSPQAEAILRCTKEPVTLVDVVPSGTRAVVTGVAQRRLVGQRAVIRLGAAGRRVGSAVIRADGTFSARVARPPAAIRYTDAARYYAVAGGRRTTALKYARRMAVTGLSAAGGRVTFRGRVAGPRFAARPVVVLRVRESCARYRVVARVRPDAQGRFVARVAAPRGAGAAVYRAQTVVPSVAGSTRRRSTFTLPRVIGL